MEKLRIAHISDLHFASVCLSPLQFFSKRWVGNINLLFKRKRDFQNDKLTDLIPIFRKHGVRLILITGDLSTTGRKKEFLLAQNLFAEFEKEGMKVFPIPGNHDHYTTRDWKKKQFYDFFSEKDLKNHGVATLDLNDNWTLVALDTAIATSLASSQGLFSETLEARLSSILSSIPKERQVLIANHFPLFEHERPAKVLERAPSLRALLQRFPNVRFYLHGHTHSHCIADLRPSALPIVIDSGSTAHDRTRTWNLLELEPRSAKIQAFKNFSEPFSEHTWNFTT